MTRRRKIQVPGTREERLGPTPWEREAELAEQRYLLSMCLWFPRMSAERQSTDHALRKYGEVPLALWHLDDYVSATEDEREAGFGYPTGRAFARFVRSFDNATHSLRSYGWAVCHESGSVHDMHLVPALKREELSLNRLAGLSGASLQNGFTWTPEWPRWLPSLQEPASGLYIWALTPVGWYKVHSVLKTLVKVHDSSVRGGVRNIHKASLSRYCITEERLMELRKERGLV